MDSLTLTICVLEESAGSPHSVGHTVSHRLAVVHHLVDVENREGGEEEGEK